MSNYENLNDLEMSSTNHNIEFEQRLTEELLDSIQTSNTTSTHNELIGLQNDEYVAEPLNPIDLAINLRTREEYNFADGWAGTSGFNTYIDNGWIRFETPTTAIPLAPYIDNRIDKLPKLMELILKCIEKGVSPRILIDISEQIKKEGNVDIIITQLKEYLEENANSVDGFVDGLVDDIEKTVCGKKIIKNV